MKKKSLGFLAILATLFLLIPRKILRGELSDWLVWGGVASTVAAIVALFTPAAPLAPVLGGAEVVAIVVGVVLHPSLEGVFVASGKFDEPNEKLMLAEFLITDLAMLDVPSGEDSQYAPLYEQANAMIAEYNQLRQLVEDGGNNSAAVTAINKLADEVSLLADEIEISGLDMLVTYEQLNSARASIDQTGLPAFELDHLERSGFSDAAMESFANMHLDPSPDGNNFTADITLSDTVRNVASLLHEIASDLGDPHQLDKIPLDDVVAVVLSSP